MRSILVVCGGDSNSHRVFFHKNPIEIPTKVESVVVYPRGAQIERKASKSISIGRQMLSFTGLSSELDEATINVSANGGITVLSVTKRVSPLRQSSKNLRS